MKKKNTEAETAKNSSMDITLPLIREMDIAKVLIQVCEHLSKRTELHIHFIINSTVVGNDLNNSNIAITVGDV